MALGPLERGLENDMGIFKEGTEVQVRSVGRISKRSIDAIVRPAKGSRAVLWDT
jgi:hypothetical protein